MAIVELTDNVLLDSNSLRLEIDTSNLIGEKTNAAYTATQDCYISAKLEIRFQASLLLDGVAIMALYGADSIYQNHLLTPFFMRKGQELTISRQNTSHDYVNFKIYGIK